MKNLLCVLGIVIMGLTSNLLHAQWVQMSNGMGNNKPVLSLATLGNNIFAGTDNNTGGVYLSTNDGTSWTQNGLVNEDVACFVVLGTNIYAGTDNHGVFLSTNNGVTWTQTSLNTQKVNSLVTLGTNIFAGALNNGGVYLSTNNGITWTQTALNNQSVHPLATLGTNIYAGTGSGVYLSTNNGTNWTQTALNNGAVISLATIGTNIFAGTYGVYLSTNNGTSWTQTALNNKSVYSFAVSGTNIFAGTDSNGVYLSTNNGTSWTQQNQGFNVIPTVTALLIANNYIFAGTWGVSVGQSVWRRTLSEMITSVPAEGGSPDLPTHFSLDQNYPNPFNPTTTIEYQIPNQSLVTLKIFDVLGREVSTLVNEQKDAGSYKAQFNGSGLSSGAYIFRLTAGGSVQVQRMLLLK
jgi:hypothetical protein